MSQDDGQKREKEKKEDHRKERVIHTRVPAVLDRELKRLAENLKVPVSNVIRTILEDAVDTLDSVGQLAEGELRDVADRLSRHRTALKKKRARGSLLEGVVGFQELTLASDDERCGGCLQALLIGEKAFLGVRDAAGPRVLLCPDCLSKATQPNQERP